MDQKALARCLLKSKIKPIMFGGHQEDSLRPGTENVAGIVGFGSAIELLCEADYKNEILKVGELRLFY